MVYLEPYHCTFFHHNLVFKLIMTLSASPKLPADLYYFCALLLHIFVNIFLHLESLNLYSRSSSTIMWYEVALMVKQFKVRSFFMIEILLEKYHGILIRIRIKTSNHILIWCVSTHPIKLLLQKYHMILIHVFDWHSDDASCTPGIWYMASTFKLP